MIQGYPSFRGRFVLSVQCLMELPGDRLFMIVSLFRVLNSSVSCTKTVWILNECTCRIWDSLGKRVSERWTFMKNIKPIQPHEIIKKSRHPDPISRNLGNRIIPSSSWSCFNYRTAEVALLMVQGHSGQSRIMTNNPFRWTMARDKSWYIRCYPEKFILGPMNARNSLTILPHTVDLRPSLMVLFQEPPEDTFEDGDDALKVPWMQWTRVGWICISCMHKIQEKQQQWYIPTLRTPTSPQPTPPGWRRCPAPRSARHSWRSGAHRAPSCCRKCVDGFVRRDLRWLRW